MSSCDATISVKLLQSRTQSLQDDIRRLLAAIEHLNWVRDTETSLVLNSVEVVQCLCKSQLTVSIPKLITYLGDNFGAEYCCFYCFNGEAAEPQRRIDGLHFRTGAHAIRRAFLALLEHRMPLCDSLQDEHQLLLFGNRQSSFKSSLLIPFSCGAADALAVLASSKVNRYRRGFSVDYLSSICAILGGELDRREDCLT